MATAPQAAGLNYGRPPSLGKVRGQARDWGFERYCLLATVESRGLSTRSVPAKLQGFRDFGRAVSLAKLRQG